MSYYWKLLLFFGCSCLGLEAAGLLLLVNQNGPLAKDQIVLHIMLPILGVVSLLICYLWHKVTYGNIGRKGAKKKHEEYLSKYQGHEVPEETTEPAKRAQKVTKPESERTAPMFIAKIFSYVLKHKKVFLILFAVCAVLCIVSWIAAYSLDTYWSNLWNHYEETATTITVTQTLYGCGLNSCKICEGTRILCEGVYCIEKIHFVMYMCEGCAICATICGFAAIAFVALGIATYVYYRKNILRRRK